MLHLGDDRAHRGGRIGGDAGLVVGDLGLHLGEYSFVDLLVDEGAAGRAARLSAPGEVHAADDAVGDFVGIGIGKRDQRILAAEFEHHGFERVGCRLHHRAAGRHRADQRDHGDVGMRGERGAGFAAAGHEIEHAGRQDVADQLGEAERGQRRLFRRLHHHRIAGGERGRGLAGAEHERVVERNDAADDAARLAHREVHHARSHRDRGAFHLGDEAGIELDLRRGDGGVLDHLGERIAAIGGVDQRQFLGVVAQHSGDALQQPRPLERRRVAPGRERRLGRAHRGIDIGCAAIGDRAERFTGAGIDRVGVAA